jgi:hypothetical protein
MFPDIEDDPDLRYAPVRLEEHFWRSHPMLPKTLLHRSVKRRAIVFPFRVRWRTLRGSMLLMDWLVAKYPAAKRTTLRQMGNRGG